MPKVTEAIQSFLRTRRETHNAPELLDRWTPFMETQVNMAADNGEPVDGKRSTYTDGEYEWFNIRIPKNAAGEPEFRDYELRCPLELHVEAIGWTGWDWSARKSRAWGFDFDAITGHAKGIGVSDTELERIKQAAMSLPYVEVRRSTGGAGIHLYVYCDAGGVSTANHTEHSALGRCILGMMSSETGFDFASQIDACGGNMWIWHRKMTAVNEGLKLLKAAEKTLTVADLPSNWRDHVEVVTRRRAKIRVSGELKDENLDPFEALTSARKIVPLDDDHKALMDELIHSGFSTIWIPDHHLLQTHTCALAKMLEEGKAQGIFKTNSRGAHPQTPNCFMFPLDKGGWKVFRFSPGTNEDESWNQDKEGWTTCYFNCRPNLATAAKAMGGQEDPEKGGYVFDTAAEANEVARVLGQHIDLPVHLLEHQSRLKTHRDGRIVLSVCKKRGEQDETVRGWISNPDAWVKLLNVFAEPGCENALKHVRKPKLVIPRMSCAELDRGSDEIDFLIDQVLVARQPGILGGAQKTLKTSIALDLAISVTTGVPFLGQFPVRRTCNTIVISVESGIDTIRATARRICKSKNITLADIANLTVSGFIPQLDNAEHLEALDRFITDTAAEVVVVDPAYLAMPGSDAGNVMAQGERLARVNAICQRHRACFVLLHHNTKTSVRQNNHKPARLDNLAWSGYAEWARQWILLGRREDYVEGTGLHNLWMNVGGSAGYSSLWALDVDEEFSGGRPHHWKVALSTPSEVCEKKEARKADSHRQRILEAAKKFPDGDTMSVILATAGVKHDKKASAFMETLVEEGALRHKKVEKKGVAYDGFCLAQAV